MRTLHPLRLCGSTRRVEAKLRYLLLGKQPRKLLKKSPLTTLVWGDYRSECGKLPLVSLYGLVLVQAPPFTDYRYGDRLRTEGKLQTPTDTADFSYREYLARQGAPNEDLRGVG